MSILIQDGKANGHRSWLIEALERNFASGAVISPFATPPEPAPRRPAARDIARDVLSRNGELIFDATTHALVLPGVNGTEIYDTWNLWSGDPGDLSSPDLVAAHVQRVFEVQEKLGAPRLTPTVPMDAAINGPSARVVLALAEEGSRQHTGAWQSLAGSRSFWNSGASLDAFVGSLAQLRAPVWVLTMIRDRGDYPPDASDVEAEAGFVRTVHSLSIRSRVIVAHGDFFAMAAVAAGADTVGTGWHTGQRVFSADSYRERSGGMNRRYVTHGVLLARLRPDVADALDRTNARFASQMRDGAPMPFDDAGARAMHLSAVRSRIDRIMTGGSRASRIGIARELYATAQEGWARSVALLPGLLRAADADAWVANPRAGLERYAISEGI